MVIMMIMMVTMMVIMMVMTVMTEDLCAGCVWEGVRLHVRLLWVYYLLAVGRERWGSPPHTHTHTHTHTQITSQRFSMYFHFHAELDHQTKLADNQDYQHSTV